MKIHAQHNQWEAKRRTGCNCCMWLLTGNGARDRQSENHSPPVTLAWQTFHLRHQRTDVSSSRLTRGSSRLEPREKCVIREFFCQASHTSDSVLSRSALACTWSPEPKPLLLKVNCLKYGRLFTLRKKKYMLIVTFYFTIQIFSPHNSRFMSHNPDLFSHNSEKKGLNWKSQFF